MKSVHSMVVGFDGESKCGKTTYIEAVKAEAEYQAQILDDVLDPATGILKHLNTNPPHPTVTYLDSLRFRNVTTVSAGNVFRAAAFYAIRSEHRGVPKPSFYPHDTDKLREMLNEDGILDFLQDDPEVGSRVTPTAKLPGVQALCGAIFCDRVSQDYQADGGHNLVIIDARDPVATMGRNNLIGLDADQIHPASVLPIYLDTPTDVAASRMKGDYEANLAIVTGRRHEDATRTELPVARPTAFITDFTSWRRQFTVEERRETVGLPYLRDNGERVSLGSIQYFAGLVAVAAQDQAYHLQQTQYSADEEALASSGH